MAKKTEQDKLREQELRLTLNIIKSGYAGVMPNGNIVDRRKYPEAIPIPENPMFNTPEPKSIKNKINDKYRRNKRSHN